MSTSNTYLVSLKYHHDNVVQSSDYVDEGLDCWQRKRDLQEVRINNCHNLFLFTEHSLQCSYQQGVERNLHQQVEK